MVYNSAKSKFFFYGALSRFLGETRMVFGKRLESAGSNIDWLIIFGNGLINSGRQALRLYNQLADQNTGAPPASAPGPDLDFGPERGPGKGTMADLGPLIRHLVSTRLPSGGRAAFLSPLSPLYGTRPSV